MNENKQLLLKFESPFLQTANRFVMAPLTRQRAGSGLAPTKLNALYYGQRATAGIIVSEATQISPKGMGYANTPGIYSQQQIEGWKHVTDAVHEQGGKIFCQLWHVGRHSHPLLQADGGLPFAPSAVAEPGLITTPHGKMPAVVPHAMTRDDIQETIYDYARAARNAMKAGFDGVEIHAANGYLIEQFLNDNTNLRTDAYGGNIQNKCRFAIEVTQAVVQSIGHRHTGIRLSPSGTNFGLRNTQPVETFEYLVHQLSPLKLAYFHMIEPDQNSITGLPAYLKKVTAHFRPIIEGAVISGGGYDFALAEKMIASGEADLIAFGKHFISNPDLVARYAADAPLNEADPSTFYGGGERGYTDYPFFNP